MLKINDGMTKIAPHKNTNPFSHENLQTKQKAKKIIIKKSVKDKAIS